MAKWRALFSPQATSLLLVAAVVMLAVITVQTRAAAVAARQQTVVNKTIITSQATSDRAATLRAQQQAVAGAALAAQAIKSILTEEQRRSNVSDARMASLIAGLQAQLLVALSRLQDAITAQSNLISMYAQQDRQRDNRRNAQPVNVPSSRPSPSPTCVDRPPVPKVCR